MAKETWTCRLLGGGSEEVLKRASTILPLEAVFILEVDGVSLRGLVEQANKHGLAIIDAEVIPAQAALRVFVVKEGKDGSSAFIGESARLRVLLTSETKKRVIK